MDKQKRPKSVLQISGKYDEIMRTFKVSDLSPAVSEMTKGRLPEGKAPGKKTLTALETMVYNMALIQNYYDISIEQARFSFALAVAVCALGIGFFLYASINVLVFQVELSSAMIPAIGGALTEIIAGTVFFLYKKSLEQLNIYFSSLENNEKFLSAVNLAEKISPDKQDDILCEIIRSRLNGALPKKPDDIEPNEAKP